MENTSVNTTGAASIAAATIGGDQLAELCVDLIEDYRKFEKQQYISANDTMESIFLKEEQWKVEHIQDQWKWKKKNFGTWYMNLDVRNRIAFIHYFGIVGSDDQDYLDKTKDNPVSTMFLEPPVIYSGFKKVIMFFLNHGISNKPVSWLELTNTPKFGGKSFDEKDPCFGNSKNWGNYILSLPAEDRKRVIRTILENYKS